MQYSIVYKAVKHAYIKIDRNGIVKITIPRFVLHKKHYEEQLIQKAEQMRNKSQNKILNKIQRWTDEHLLIFGEEVPRKEVNITGDSHKTQKSYAKIGKKILLEYITDQAQKYAKTIGYEYADIKIKLLRSRRGSCSSDQRLVFNLDLLCVPTRLVEYVVVHEVCHLKEKNHGKAFRALVELLLPKYKTLRKELKQTHIL